MFISSTLLAQHALALASMGNWSLIVWYCIFAVQNKMYSTKNFPIIFCTHATNTFNDFTVADRALVTEMMTENARTLALI